MPHNVTARDKLNLVCAGGAIGLAALIDGLSGSWMIFLLLVIALVTLLSKAGLIR